MAVDSFSDLRSNNNNNKKKDSKFSLDSTRVKTLVSFFTMFIFLVWKCLQNNAYLFSASFAYLITKFQKTLTQEMMSVY